MKTISVSQLRRLLTSVDSLLTTEGCISLTRGLVGEREGGEVFAYLMSPAAYAALPKSIPNPVAPPTAEERRNQKEKMMKAAAALEALKTKIKPMPTAGLDNPGTVKNIPHVPSGASPIAVCPDCGRPNSEDSHLDTKTGVYVPSHAMCPSHV